jgi:hypothetical protein
MPKSRKPRKPYHPKDWSAEAAKARAPRRSRAQMAAIRAGYSGEKRVKPTPRTDRPEAERVARATGTRAVYDPATRARLAGEAAHWERIRNPPAGTATWEGNTARSASRGHGHGKIGLLALGALTAASLGGNGLLLHRNHNQKVAKMSLVDPFSEVVVFGKAVGRSGDGKYRVVWPPASATSLRSLVPTGRHVGTANNLVHVHGVKTKGRNANSLEHYSKAYVPSMGRELHEAARDAERGVQTMAKIRASHGLTSKAVLDLRASKTGGSRFQSAGARGMKLR